MNANQSRFRPTFPLKSIMIAHLKRGGRVFNTCFTVDKIKTYMHHKSHKNYALGGLYEVIIS